MTPEERAELRELVGMVTAVNRNTPVSGTTAFTFSLNQVGAIATFVVMFMGAVFWTVQEFSPWPDDKDVVLNAIRANQAVIVQLAREHDRVPYLPDPERRK